MAGSHHWKPHRFANRGANRRPTVFTMLPWPAQTATASGPTLPIVPAMRSSASSQEVSRHASSVRTSRRRGRRTRIGLSMISREAWPRMQRKPRLSGFSSSPRMLRTRSSWISTSIPQYVGWQFMGHMVRTRRIAWLGGRSLPVIGLFSLLAFATTLARRTTFAEPGAIQSRHPRQVQGSSGPSASTVAPLRVLASAPPS